MAAARRRIAARRNWPPNLYRNSQGYYWFRNPDTKETFGLGRDFRLASAQARTANAELERRKGAVSLIQRIDGAADSLASWCDKYQERNLGGSKNTQVGMRSQLKAIREAEFSSQSMAQIRPKEIAAFISSAAETRGPAMALRIRTRLYDVFRDAIECGLVEVGKNPVEVIARPKQTVSRQRLTLDDYRAILAEARREPRFCWAANAIELALVTGQRREDISRMKFEDVRDGFLWVHQSKTGVKIRIPLSLRLDCIGASVGDVLRRCRDSVVSKHVIHFVRANAGVKPGDSPAIGYFSENFSKFRDAAGIKVEEGKTPPSFHELRSLAARLYTEQYGKEFAQALLGHKSSAMTDLYRDSRGVEWAEIKITAR